VLVVGWGRRSATRSGTMAINLWLEAAFNLFCSACERGEMRNGRLNSGHVIEAFYSCAIVPPRITARLNQITAVLSFTNAV
jgi:hypothetical protein